MRNALIVGINNYPGHKLNCCVNDANEVARLLEYNEDESRNFSIIKLLNEQATYDNILDKLRCSVMILMSHFFIFPGTDLMTKTMGKFVL